MKPDFAKSGLLPAIIQHAVTRQVLMLGYMNEEAYEKTRATGLVTFYSRSRQKLWIKGATSGNFLHLKEMLLDCDNDTLLIQALPDGPTCHSGSESCFHETTPRGFLYQLETIIAQRTADNVPDSYTNRLFRKGINKVAQKVGEEAVELIIEAKDNDQNLFLNEVADLLFHLLILLRAKNLALEEVEQVLKHRNG